VHPRRRRAETCRAYGHGPQTTPPWTPGGQGIEAAFRRAGRTRGIEDSAAELRTILHRPHLRQDPLVEQAMGMKALPP
jgi:hypothetical protein